ncbi:unnamed protein product [Rangifer tarandus platyrhynchus]|uniref:Uncharacterized protein n=2 Tax=Rangifer tarandus platyrhynchus TaxID=3082113 RepID=A0AC59ZZ83_RANTA|nr:unnamed protein product [Rangifer tarandus platyrhynchus]
MLTWSTYLKDSAIYLCPTTEDFSICRMTLYHHYTEVVKRISWVKKLCALDGLVSSLFIIFIHQYQKTLKNNGSQNLVRLCPLKLNEKYGDRVWRKLKVGLNIQQDEGRTL